MVFWEAYGAPPPASAIAPSGKLITAIAMAILLFIVAIFVIGVHFAYPERFSTHPFFQTLECVATLFGAVLAIVAVARDS